jgi:hypothetical protein
MLMKINTRKLLIFGGSVIIAQLKCSRCLAHVVNLGVIAMMAHITKIAAVETTTAIWDYNPSLDDHQVLGGSLNVIAIIRTLAIKVSFCLSYCYTSFSFPTDLSIRAAD